MQQQTNQSEIYRTQNFHHILNYKFEKQRNPNEETDENINHERKLLVNWQGRICAKLLVPLKIMLFDATLISCKATTTITKYSHCKS